MATFKCEVVNLEIEDHPNADALEIAKINGKGYMAIVRKGQFKTGDVAVYIPEQAIVPEWLIKRLGLEGRLAGPDHNRVKAVKLRGVLSQGLVYPVEHFAYKVQRSANGVESFDDGGILELENNKVHVKLHQDVTEILGVTKWEPPIPMSMSGEVCAIYGKTLKYDIENVKNYPEVVDRLINLGIEVSITEKLHGTWCCIGYYPQDIHDELPAKRWVITSKGLSEKGLAFKDVSQNDNNIYMKMFKSLYPDYESKVYLDDAEEFEEPIFILGEIFGKGIQDLHYGYDKPHFRIFDVYFGPPGQGYFLNPLDIDHFIKNNNEFIDEEFLSVPELYTGPLSWDIINELTSGKDLISGTNIREGIVIKPLDSILKVPELSRLILKSVSEEYLSRKGGSEYN